MLHFEKLNSERETEIRNWPDYPEGYSDFTFAFREGGWLDLYGKEPDAEAFGCYQDAELIGLVMLIHQSGADGEIMLALHPQMVGKGLGGKMLAAALDFLFQRNSALESVRLIVRKTNRIAQNLYRKIGFLSTGESVHFSDRMDREFYDMIMPREKWMQRNDGFFADRESGLVQ